MIFYGGGSALATHIDDPIFTYSMSLLVDTAGASNAAPCSSVFAPPPAAAPLELCSKRGAVQKVPLRIGEVRAGQMELGADLVRPFQALCSSPSASRALKRSS